MKSPIPFLFSSKAPLLGTLAALAVFALNVAGCRAAETDEAPPKAAAKKTGDPKKPAKAADGQPAEGTLMVEAQVKPNQPWKKYPTRTLETLPNFKAGATKPELDKYGGWKKITAPATGFFYPKKIDGRFWLVDPEGNAFIHTAIVNVIPGKSENMKANLQKKYGSEAKWAADATKLVHDTGFNGTGAWSSDELLRQTPTPVVYTPAWSFMAAYGKQRGGTKRLAGHAGYPKNTIFVFDPGFEEFADEYAKQLAKTKDDPYLLGHFSDNEMPWPKNALDSYLSLPADDHGHIAAQKWLDARPKKEGSNKPGPTNDDRQQFIGFMADRYFSIVSKAIKKYDPNHLYLGSRFYGGDVRNDELFKAAGKYVDVVSVNYYNEWTPNNQEMTNWLNWSHRPFLITEWYTKGADSGMRNGSGAGWVVKTQKDRGLFYQNFALGLLQNPACVGWHWFKYMDNDPADTSTDPSNRDSNKGMVKINYEPFPDLLQAMNALNREVYPLIEYFGKK